MPGKQTFLTHTKSYIMKKKIFWGALCPLLGSSEWGAFSAMTCFLNDYY